MGEQHMKQRAEEFYDSIVIGGGPAGLTAAIYLARAKYRVLVIEKEKMGGQITITSEVVNYPGVLKTDGTHLTENMRKQAEYFGADFKLAEVKELDLDGDIKSVVTDKGTFQGLGIILATGASPRRIGFQGEMEFRGRGVAYCATCDGEFFTGMDVFVIGGGFAAAEEAIFLTKYAKKVRVMVRGERFTCAESIAQEVLAHPDIEVHFETEIKEAGGNGKLEYAIFREKDRTWRYEPKTGEGFGIFVFAGYEPANVLFKNKLKLAEGGYLLTDINQKTSIDGVYGAGDICVKNLRQVVTAVSDGAVAATSLEKHISSLYEKLELKKQEVKRREYVLEEEKTDKTQAEVSGEFLNDEVKRQLVPVLERLEKEIILEFCLDHRPISQEAKNFGEEMSRLSPKIKCSFQEKTENEATGEYPSIRICDADGRYMGTSFHGIPGGHEFNSFVIALYNAAGPGQSIDPQILEKIQAFDKEHKIQAVVSLSCTMCPDLVMALQRIAIESEKITADIYDMAHFPELKDKYQIMSVPCMIIDEEHVYFGKKGLDEVVDLLENI
nr:FAD-dependent oxidoreductase [uncultured Anaerostipes sp.]